MLIDQKSLVHEDPGPGQWHKHSNRLNWPWADPVKKPTGLRLVKCRKLQPLKKEALEPWNKPGGHIQAREDGRKQTSKLGVVLYIWVILNMGVV